MSNIKVITEKKPDAERIKLLLKSQIESVVQHLLPNGKKQGNEWVTGDLNDTSGKSLKVHLTGEKTGIWCDFATGEKGDIFELWMNTKRLSFHDALKDAAAFVGEELSFSQDYQQKQNQQTNKPITEQHDSKTDTQNKPKEDLRTIDILCRLPLPPENKPMPLEVTTKQRSYYAHELRAVYTYITDRFFRLRYEFIDDKGTNGKAVIPVHWNGNDWKCKEPAGKLPLFKWEEIETAQKNNQNKKIIFCEGEKTVYAAQKLFPDDLVTTTQGGSSHSKKSDFSLVKDMIVIIWPDNDPPGSKYKDDLINLLFKHKAKEVYVINLKMLHKYHPKKFLTLPVGWDAADAVKEGFTAEIIKNLMKDNKDFIIQQTEASINGNNKPNGSTLEGTAGKVSDATMAYRLVRGMVNLFTGHDSNQYATIKKTSEIHEVSSQSFRNFITKNYQNAFGEVLSRCATEDCIAAIRADAYYKKTHEIFKRVGYQDIRDLDDYTVYLDLTNQANEIIKIDRNGRTTIQRNKCPVKLIKYDGMGELPTPEEGGNIYDLFKVINIPPKSQKMFIACLIDYFFPDTMFPILALHGCKGSAKSTAQTFIRRLIDPLTLNASSGSIKKEDLYTSASKGYMVTLDNVHSLSQEKQDQLCRISTEKAIETRQLYSTANVRTLMVKSPIIITSISDVVTNPDLVRRTISIEMMKLPDNIDIQERNINKEFELIRPKLLGCLLHLVSEVIKTLPTLKNTKLPNMPDFFKVGVALEKILGWEECSFAQEFDAHQKDVTQSSMESRIMITAIRNYLEEHKELFGTWSHVELELRKQAYNNTRSENWISNARQLSYEVRDFEEQLLDIGIQVTRIEKNAPGIPEARGHTLVKITQTRFNEPQSSRGDICF